MLNFIFGITATILFLLILSTFLEHSFLCWIESNFQLIQVFFSIGIFISAVIALSVFRKSKSEDNLKSCKDILKKSFNIFTNNKQNMYPPKNDRFLWLSTARMLIRYESLKKNVTFKAHKNILETYEEYWRFEFYAVLDKNKETFTLDYFLASGSFTHGENIEETSIVKIYEFASWKEGKKDPLKSFDIQKHIDNVNVFQLDQPGVKEYLNRQSERRNR